MHRLSIGKGIEGTAAPTSGFPLALAMEQMTVAIQKGKEVLRSQTSASCSLLSCGETLFLAVNHYGPWHHTCRTRVMPTAVSSAPGDIFGCQQNTLPTCKTGTIVTNARPLITHTWGFNPSSPAWAPGLLPHSLTSVPLRPGISPWKGGGPQHSSTRSPTAPSARRVCIVPQRVPELRPSLCRHHMWPSIQS